MRQLIFIASAALIAGCTSTPPAPANSPTIVVTHPANRSVESFKQIDRACRHYAETEVIAGARLHETWADGVVNNRGVAAHNGLTADSQQRAYDVFYLVCHRAHGNEVLG